MTQDEGEDWTEVLGVNGERCWRSVVRVAMRDGVELVADRYVADIAAPAQPVILERTPYERRKARASELIPGHPEALTPSQVAAYFAVRGYNVVMQDCRGRGDSGGTFVKYLSEGEDGFDTVEWLGTRPWCDGRVVTMGLSYCAHVQAALASLGPAHLAAMFMDSGGFASAYEAGGRQGGVFELKQVTWAFNHARQSPEAKDSPRLQAALDAEDIGEWFRVWPWRTGMSPLRHVPDYEKYLLEQYRHEAFTSYWRQVGLYGRGYYSSFPDVPTLHMSGWYDPYARTAVDNFNALRSMKQSSCFLVMGPWTHGARSKTYAGEVDFGAAATLDGSLDDSYLAFRERWFRAQLHPDRAAQPAPAVRFFLMGGGDGTRTPEGRLRHGGQWLAAQDWPPAGSVVTEWFLRAGGGLDVKPPTEDEAFVEYDFDPRSPTPTVGGSITSGEPLMVGGAFDQRWDERTTASPLPLEARGDVASFETGPLAEDIAVAGRCVADLWISSSAKDTDFVWKLIDVYPPSDEYPQGFAMNVTDGILRCRFRDGFEVPQEMVPGQPYRISIEAPDTANLFRRGHRIRVSISSSNFPRFDVNRNLGLVDGWSNAASIARNRIFLSACQTSSIRLPILPGMSGTAPVRRLASADSAGAGVGAGGVHQEVASP